MHGRIGVRLIFFGFSGHCLTMHAGIFSRMALLAGVAAFGCAAGVRSRAAPTTAPASQPVRLLTVSQGVGIDAFRRGDTDVDLPQVIRFPGASDVYFGSADTTDADQNITATTPLIVKSLKRGWRALSVADPRLPDAEWVFVASGPASQEMWGVLDNQIGDPGTVLLLAHSTDAGKSWSLNAIDKPFHSGEYDSFAMDKTGRGRLTIYVTRKTAHGHAGFYHLRTSDGGMTWSSPQYEADALLPADDVTEDEPEPLRSPPTQNAEAPHPLRGGKDVARSNHALRCAEPLARSGFSSTRRAGAVTEAGELARAARLR
jgi:hypothetical protein